MTTPVERKLTAQKQISQGAPRRAVTSARLHRPVNQQEMLDTAARLACQLLKGDIAAISLADEEGHLAIHSHFGLTEECAARLRANARYAPLGFIAGKKGRSHIVTGQELEDLTPGLNLRTMVVMPLKIGKTLMGYLGVGYRKERKLTAHELQLARLFADYATIGIETGVLYQKERHERHRSSALLSAVAASGPNPGLKAVLTKLCRSVLKLSVAERCVIFLLSEDRRSLEAQLALGGDMPPKWKAVDDGEINDSVMTKIMGLLEGNRRPLIDENVTASGFLSEDWAESFNVKSCSVYPLVYRRRPVGLLAVYSYRDYVAFPEEEVATLSAIAKQAAVIIENARLYERERRQRQRSETLTKVLTAAASTLDLQQVLSKVCDAALELTIGDDVGIFLIDNQTGVLTPMMAVGREQRGALNRFLKAPPQLLRAPETVRLYHTVSRRKNPLIIEDTANSPLISPWWVENFDTRSLVHYPLRVQKKTIGSLAVSSHGRKVRFPPEEIDTLAAVAKQAAVIIENARVYEREQRQRKQSETLSAVLTAATSTLSLREMLSKVCESTLSLTVGDGVSIFLVDAVTGGSVPMMAAGRRQRGSLSRFLAAPSEATEHLGAQSFFKAIARRKTPLLIKDAATSPFISPWWVEKFGVKSMVAYPLVVKGKTIGTMIVDAADERVRFPREEIDALAPVAGQVAVIIENARLYEHEQLQRQRTEKVSQALAPASATLSVRKACTAVCEAALQVTVGDQVSIFLHTQDNQAFTPMSAAGRGSLEDLKAFKNPPPSVQSSAGPRLFNRMLARRRKPYIIEDLAASPHGNHWWAEHFQLKSLAYYPLRTKDKLIGFMSVACVEEKRRFPQEEVDSLAAIAKQAAVIIENARLYEKQQVQRQRAEALVGVLTAAASTLSLKNVLAQLCQTVVDISVADRVSIFMMAEDGTHLEPVMSLGVRDSKMWDQFRNPRPGFEMTPESRQLFERVTAMAEPIIADDAVSSPFIDSWWVDTFGIKSIAQYPLRVKDQTIGMMTVDAFRHPVHFPKEEIETLAAIAKQAGVIIENARVYEREQQQRQRAEALLDVLTTAASNMGLRKVLVKICQTAVAISVADRCSIFVTDDEGRLKPMMSLGVEDPAAWERFRDAQALAGDRATTPDLRRFYGALSSLEDPLVVEDAATSKLIPKWWTEAFEVKSLVHYPLRIQDRTIGLMSVDSFRQKVDFPKEEIETLAAIARQAAVVIENARLHEQLKQQAITDHITGLFNHRHMFQRLDEEFARAERSKGAFAVMMMDLDKFKEVNDTYGHLEGDEALRFIGKLLRKALRASDIIGRYGGDEFIAVLPDTTRDAAEEVAERLMNSLAETPFYAESVAQNVSLAASIGFAVYPQDGNDREQLLLLADAALYEAKRLGGKRALPVNAPEATTITSPSLGFDLLQGLLNAVAHKDRYTHRHCEDNVRYAELLAEQLHLSSDATESLRKAALLHDVGKIAIPDEALLKPGPLDANEWEIMQQHVRFGETIVKGVAQISDAIEPVATHHERFDGTGYPRGLKGKDIPLLGRILAVVDAFSAMTLDRPYRKALTKAEAIKELRNGAGTQFDPEVVTAFLEALAASEKARRKVA